MASQGPNNPGTVVSDATIGSISWDTLTVETSNDVRAGLGTESPVTPTRYLKCTNFGFSIPGGATIDGIIVGIERRDTQDDQPRDNSVRLFDPIFGGYVGTDKATTTNWPLTDTYEDHGASGDAWGYAWTPTLVNNSGFGVGVSVKHWGFSLYLPEIDHIRMTVYYTDVTAPSPIPRVGKGRSAGN